MDDELIDLEELLRGQCGSSRRAFCLGAGAGLVVLAAGCEAPNPRLDTGALDNPPGGLPGGTTTSATGGTTGNGTTGGGTTGGGTTGGGTTGGTTGGGTTGSPAMCDSTLVAAGPASAVAVGKAKHVVSGQLDAWLCRDSQGWYAMDNYCPHRGCGVSFQSSGGFYCGCHGATFDYNGAQTNRVSPAPMDHLVMCVDASGNAFIDPNNTVSASQRY